MMIPSSQVVASTTLTNATELNTITDKVGAPSDRFNEDGIEFLIWDEMDEVSYEMLLMITGGSWRIVA